MAKFTFRLEPLLRARLRHEQMRQRVVAELEGRRRELEDRLRSQQGFIRSGKESQAERLLGPLDMTKLRAHAGATVHLMRQAQRILLELAGVHRQMEKARQELVEAARQRRAMELLRENRLREWRKRLNRAEDAALDDLASTAAAGLEFGPKDGAS